MMNTLMVINNLLNKSKYIIVPKIIPKKIYALISPLLNLNIEYSTIVPVITQKITSSIYVIKSLVLKDFLSILNISNIKPIKKPFRIKIKKM